MNAPECRRPVRLIVVCAILAAIGVAAFIPSLVMARPEERTAPLPSPDIYVNTSLDTLGPKRSGGRGKFYVTADTP